MLYYDVIYGGSIQYFPDIVIVKQRIGLQSYDGLLWLKSQPDILTE